MPFASNTVAPSPFTFSNRITAAYRDSGMTEITGNEQSLTAWYWGALRFQKGLWGAHVEGVLLEDLSLKGRVADQMAPPRLLLNTLCLHLQVSPTFRIEAGVLRPLTWQFPLTAMAPPVVFQNGTLPSGALTPVPLTTGWRDVPLPYAGAIPWTDTGFVFSLSQKYFFGRLGWVNGEEGLDANSSPSVSLDLRFGTAQNHLGLCGQFGEIGSVPVKEWKDQVMLYGTVGEKIRVGFSAMFCGSGIRATNSLGSSNALLSAYGYKNNPFNAFSMAAEGGRRGFLGLDPSLVPGLGAVLWFEIPFLPDDSLSLSGHFSVYDGDFLSDIGLERQMKWRASTRILVQLVPGLSAFASYTYTHDPVFQDPNGATPLDREPRPGHPLVPQDILVGFTGFF